MSLLDNPPHTVTVQNRTITQNAHGATLEPDGAPVVVECAFQPMSASESNDFDGAVTFEQKRVIARDWPGNATSEVMGPDGHTYDTVGDPQHYNMSPATAHWEVVLQRQGNA